MRKINNYTLWEINKLLNHSVKTPLTNEKINNLLGNNWISFEKRNQSNLQKYLSKIGINVLLEQNQNKYKNINFVWIADEASYDLCDTKYHAICKVNEAEGSQNSWNEWISIETLVQWLTEDLIFWEED